MPVVYFPVQPGANRDLSIQLFEKQPPITVDSNGGSSSSLTGFPGVLICLSVGTIGRQTEFSPSPLLDPVVETLPPTPVSYSARAHRRSTTKKALLVGISYRDIAEGLGSGEEWGSIPTSIPNVKKFEQFIRGELCLPTHCIRNSQPFYARPLGVHRHYRYDRRGWS